jgi:hypothetical protein
MKELPALRAGSTISSMQYCLSCSCTLFHHLLNSCFQMWVPQSSTMEPVNLRPRPFFLVSLSFQVWVTVRENRLTQVTYYLVISHWSNRQSWLMVFITFQLLFTGRGLSTDSWYRKVWKWYKSWEPIFLPSKHAHINVGWEFCGLGRVGL